MFRLTRYHDDSADMPPIKLVTGHAEVDAKGLTQFIWSRVLRLLAMGKEKEAVSLIEEYDDPALWDDPLD